jgi:hypothetical protein
MVDFRCLELPLVSGRCIFHDKDYLQHKVNNDEHKRTILNRLKYKVNHAISDNETLLCIGFQLSDFCFSDLSISKKYTKPLYFSRSQFFGKADFYKAKFEGEAYFFDANFKGEAASMGLILKMEQTLIILSSTAKHTSHGSSMVKQNSIMYYLREKRKLCHMFFVSSRNIV